MADGERLLKTELSIEGRLVGAAGKADLASVDVWFAYEPVTGDPTTVRSATDSDGSFVFGRQVGS